jgi:PAS domain S-box-containing protein
VLERRSVPQFSHGLPVGRVYSFRDVTRQAETQAHLRLAARVFESSLDAIFIADSQHRILRMNPGCLKLIGSATELHVGQPAVSLFELESPDRWMTDVKAGWKTSGFWEGSFGCRGSACRLVRCSFPGSSCTTMAGKVMQSIGFMRDLTAQHNAQKRIKELAYTDVLTGLPNRLLLSQRVETAIADAQEQSGGFAVLFLILIVSRSSTIRWGIPLVTGFFSWWRSDCKPACARPTCSVGWVEMSS